MELLFVYQKLVTVWENSSLILFPGEKVYGMKGL